MTNKEGSLGVTWVVANDHAPFMNRFTVIAASGIIGLGVMGCRNDEGSSTDTAAFRDVDNSIQLGKRLRQLGLGCRDVGPSPVGSLSSSAECTIEGVRVVLNTWPDKAGRDDFLDGKPEDLCIIFAQLGEDQAAIVVGDFWTVRPDSVEVARRVASETGGRLLVADC